MPLTFFLVARKEGSSGSSPSPKQKALQDNMSKFNTTVTGSNVVVIGDNSRLAVDAGRTQSKITNHNCPRTSAVFEDTPLPPYESPLSKLFFFSI